MTELGLLGGVILIGLSLIAFNLINTENTEKTELGTYIVPGSVFSVSEISDAIKIFVSVWCKENPSHKRNLLKALKKLTIEWHSRKIIFEDKEVLALMENTSRIDLWIGPLLKNKTRRLVYTGLFDQLAKLALIVNNQDPDTSNPKIRKILVDIRNRV